MDLFEGVIFEMRHFEIRGEDRRDERDRVAGIEQASVLQRLEDIAHSRRAALDRVEIELCRRAVTCTHRPHQIFMSYGLIVHQRPIRYRVVIADNRVRQFVDELVGIEPEFHDCKIDGSLQRIGSRCLGICLAP
ncbi:hypothetical protein D3C73_1088940 [compost metagenome]